MTSNRVITHSLLCPYCAETIDILVDCSVEEQAYIEDCRVCCRPIEIEVVVDIEGNISVLSLSEQS